MHIAWPLDRYSKSGLVSQFCTPLCLQRTGSKDELIDRILDFLLNPSDAGLVSDNSYAV